MREHGVTLHSSRLNHELFTFIWKDGKAQAMKNYNDDLVMSLAIGLWIRDTALRLRNESLASTKACIGGIHRIATTTPAIYSGISAQPKNPWSFKIGNQDESLTWLL